VRILITGGAGCLGSNLVDHWQPQGHELHIVDNFATGDAGNVPDIAGVTSTEGSVTDAALIDDVFARFAPTHVVHAAAAYKDPDDWIEDTATNVTGTIVVAKAAERSGVHRLINFQTALCYGRPTSVPIPIDHPLRPFTSYGISKTAGELYLLNSGMPVVSLRLANVTGPRLAIGPIPTFYKRLKAGQNCFCSDTTRDFLDMQDFLSLMDKAMAPDGPTGVFNVSTGEGRTIKDLYDLVADYLDLPPGDIPILPPGDDDVPSVVLDPSATQAAFNWQAQHDFSATIHRMLKWYDAHGITDVYSHLKPSH